MEKKFNIVVGEDGTVKLPDAVLEKLEVKPGEEVRFEVDDNFYAVRLLSRIEAERLDYLNWMHLAVRSKTNIHFDVSFLTAKVVITHTSEFLLFADLSECSVYYLRIILRATSCFSFNRGTDTVCFFHSSIEQVTALHRRHFVQPPVSSRSTS